MAILEMGLVPSGEYFYSDEDKCELLMLLIDEKVKEAFDKGWKVGYDRGGRDEKSRLVLPDLAELRRPAPLPERGRDGG